MKRDVVQRLRELSRNLWWTWQPELIAVFRDIDPDLWRYVNHSPVAFLAQISEDKVLQAVKDKALEARLNQAFHKLQAYIEDPTTWGSLYAGPLANQPVAYFSAEFGLHESLPLYSGGLGILAGDHLATASDFGIPLVGVGLFYARGYFGQFLDKDGMQHEVHDEVDIDTLPLDLVREEDGGEPLCVEVELDDRPVAARIWRAEVGRCSLLLLDCDTPANDEQDRDLTDRLYDADPSVRLRQEVMLGIGGVRALRRLGIRPSVIHLNEGHSAFAVLERMREEIEENGVDVEEARRRVVSRTVFTTHTPVEAGHDRFALDLIDEVLWPLREKLGLSELEFHALGQRIDEDDFFCMTTFALRHSRRANAVSALHGRVARQMWQILWPDRAESEVPIGHITNGVHISSWLSPQIAAFYSECLGAGWERDQCSPGTWTPILNVEDEHIWEVHQILKAHMLEWVVRSVRYQEERRDGETDTIEYVERKLDPAVLTIAFARRFASYKRADLIFADEERLGALLNNPERPVQLIFAGKAHPRDETGKQLIRRIFKLTASDAIGPKLLFIEDYDINTARHLVQGCDVWLNTPLRTREACGTSGMKALINGALNLSVQDGWWAEAYDGSNGFTIGLGEAHADPERQWERDAAALYDVLEQQVVPLYYERNKRGVPCGWIAMMKNAIATLAWRFNSDRMLMEYARECYLPAAGIKPVHPAQERNPCGDL